MKKDLKEEFIEWFCKEYSGNRGKLTLYDAFVGIVVISAWGLFTWCVLSLIGFLVLEIKYIHLDNLPGTSFGAMHLIFIFNFNNFIIGTVMSTFFGVVGFFSIKLLKIKIMDCPVCIKEEKKEEEDYDPSR